MVHTSERGTPPDGSAKSPEAQPWPELDELVAYLEEQASVEEGRPPRPPHEVWAAIKRMAANLWPGR